MGGTLYAPPPPPDGVILRPPSSARVKGTIRISKCSKLYFIPKLYAKRFSTFHWSCWSLVSKTMLRNLQEINGLSFN